MSDICVVDVWIVLEVSGDSFAGIVQCRGIVVLCGMSFDGVVGGLIASVCWKGGWDSVFESWWGECLVGCGMWDMLLVERSLD